MSIEQVIKLGQEITKPDLPWYSEFSFGLWILIIILFIIGGALFTWGTNEFGIGKTIIGFMMVIASFIIFFSSVEKSLNKEEKVLQKEVAEWEEKYVKPYIESLIKTKKEIIYIKIDPELSHEVEGQSWWGNGYTRSTEIQRTPLTISYKDNGIVTKSNWYEAYMELTDDEKPFVEYQYLEKDLGHGIHKGMYNTKIYLPERYTFTDIK